MSLCFILKRHDDKWELYDQYLNKVLKVVGRKDIIILLKIIIIVTNNCTVSSEINHFSYL
jgi:hypothetical protein